MPTRRKRIERSAAERIAFTLRLDKGLAARLDREREALHRSEGYRFSRSGFVARALQRYFDGLPSVSDERRQ